MTKKLSRPIKSDRDYKDASAVTNKIRNQTEREPAAERRLQALIDAMEKYDSEDDEGPNDGAEEAYNLPGRRWSDRDEG
ncbi:MAG: hypothetical protein Q8K18_00720 [Burkholderiales bacterium]|nr:hypothetical protein [Burkholderiales bacterium]